MWPFKCKHKKYSSIDSMSWHNPKDMPYNMAIIYCCDKCGFLFYSRRAAFMSSAGALDDYSTGTRIGLDRSYKPVSVKRLEEFFGRHFDVFRGVVDGRRIT